MGLTSVRIQSNLSERLEEVASKLHRSKSSVINQAVDEFLTHQLQEEKCCQDTLASLESVRQGALVSGDATQSWLESWGSEDELPVPKTEQ